MSITPNEILEKEFSRGLRGYSVDEVDEFLELVADTLADAIKERNLLRERVHELQDQLDRLREEEKEIKKTLLSAQKLIDELKAQAEKEAEMIIEEARAKGERIIEEAKEEERFLKATLLDLKRKQLSWKAELRSMLKKYLDLIEKEPDFTEDTPLEKEEVKRRVTAAEAEELLGVDDFDL